MPFNLPSRRWLTLCFISLSLTWTTGCSPKAAPSDAATAARREQELAKAIADIQNNPALSAEQKEVALKSVKLGFAWPTPTK